MTADSTDLRARSWFDAFPWLVSAADSATAVWCADAIDDVDAVIRSQRLAKVCELAMAHLTMCTIGEIFPGLPASINLRRLRLPARAVNALNNHQCFRSGDLVGLTLDEMLDWRQVGVGTIDTILQALANASTAVASPVAIAEHTSAVPAQLELQLEQVRVSERMMSVVDDLSRIATWYAAVGLPCEPMLRTEAALGTPEEIVKARQRIMALTADDVLVEGWSAIDAAGHIDEALRALDPRAVQILSARLLAEDPITLDRVGKEFGISRERARQIEGSARSAVLGLLSDGGPLGLLAETVRNLVSKVRPLDDLLKLVPGFGRTVDSAGKPVWRILGRLEDAYEIENGWCMAPTMTAAQTMTQTLLQEHADRYGVVRLDNLEIIESSEPERLPELTAAWLTHCGYVVDGDFVLTRTQSVGDYGAAMLSITGSPLSTQEIVDRFVLLRTAGSLRNAMSQDDRFERVDRDRWALSEWGMEAYVGIRSLIREQVVRGGGRVKINDLVDSITRTYSVTASSVIAYASSLPFEAKDGFVRMAGADREIRKSPERTRRLFRRQAAWCHRIRITKDHLRGSGSVAPMAIAKIVGLQFGQSRQLESPLGPQTVAWNGPQPSFGTIRRFLMDGDVAADTEAFLIIGDDGSFAFEPVRELTGDSMADAMALIGAPLGLDVPAALQALAAAIGLPDGSSVATIIGGYRERDDSDIADLLTSIREILQTGSHPQRQSHTTHVEDILDLL
ncbi:sigma factor-like helix-turn-helix DNA-binding protein [Nocardia sp. NPDC051929]|uniref:sigma factor-like helix-turn-helix DNA-binding protein n=1 Tax=Nocardia sp. NPDC051929 TaxID=3364327 RepID=UPI0037C645DE